MPATVPILDAACMANGTDQERAEFGDKFLKGMAEHGFVKLVNHTVPMPVVEDTFSQVCLISTILTLDLKLLRGEQIKKFFKLPFDVKKPTINDPKKGQQRGWSPPGEEKTWWLESNTGDVESPQFGDNKVCTETPVFLSDPDTGAGKF